MARKISIIFDKLFHFNLQLLRTAEFEFFVLQLAKPVQTQLHADIVSHQMKESFHHSCD
jgi:hypothetical protein